MRSPIAWSTRLEAKKFGRSPYTLFVDAENEWRVRTETTGILQHDECAIGVYAEVGIWDRGAAQSCDGWAAAWMIRSMSLL